MNYHFDWDPRKARQNEHKHGVTFRRAVTIFSDPGQISLYDEAHSELEDRWVTIGADHSGNVLVVVHTYRVTDSGEIELRIISARKSTSQERDQYERSERK